MPDIDIIKRWVTELRSGKYNQAQERLCYVSGEGERSYCCRGVLCEMAVADGVIEPGVPVDMRCSCPKCGEDNGEDNKAQQLRYDGTTNLPSDRVLTWAGFPVSTDFSAYEGLSAYDPDFDRRIELSAMNDDKEYDFQTIADRIEAEWLCDDKENVDD